MYLLVHYPRSGNTWIRLFFLSYEQMLANPETILKSMFFWLNISFEDVVIRQAISNRSFKNLRAAEKKNL
ncbi:MAG: hypothetical protein D3924_13815 [Candidatus Electrothrix sp. AR4]|nr:hypothetical protein [Candidatus Electrothrix sp. AR4]